MRVVVFVGMLFMSACSTLSGVANRSSFNDAEALCQRDRAECERQCSPNPQGINRAACDYILVERAEQDLERYAHAVADVERICRDGIDRACRLTPDLKRLSSAQGAAQQRDAVAAKHAEEQHDEATQQLVERTQAVQEKASSLLRACGRSCGYSARSLDEAGRIAASVLTALETAHPCATGYEEQCELRRCGRNPLTGMYENCESQIAAAESKVTDAEPEMVAAQQRAATEAESRAAMDRRRTAYNRMTEECANDLDPCKQRCSEDPSHDACIVVARHMELGVGIAADVRQALKTVGSACERGNDIACGIADDIRTRASDCATAEDCKRYCDGGIEESCAYQRLPQLFAKCSKHRQHIAKLKSEGMLAARNGDAATAEAATARLTALEPEWSATRDALMRGIDVVTTDGEGERIVPAYSKLLRRVQTECSL